MVRTDRKRDGRLAPALGIVLVALAWTLSPARADGGFSEQGHRAWQLARALEPSAQQRAAERAGKVFIYDGLTEADVERIMDRAFERLESMMFVNVVAVDEDGEPLVDPETGDPLVLDDGC